MSSGRMSQNSSRWRAASSRSRPPSATCGRPLLGQLPAGLEGQQVLLLGGHQLGAVDGQQRLAAPHQLADEVHVELLDVALELGVHVVHAALVGRHPAHRAHAARQGPRPGPGRCAAPAAGAARARASRSRARPRSRPGQGRPASPARETGTRRMPQIGQSPAGPETYVRGAWGSGSARPEPPRAWRVSWRRRPAGRQQRDRRPRRLTGGRAASAFHDGEGALVLAVSLMAALLSVPSTWLRPRRSGR